MLFIFLPFIINNFLKEYNFLYKFFINNLVFTILVTILFYIFYEIVLKNIYYTCFDYPIMHYKDNAPAWCKKFNFSIYKGIGWTLKVIFLSFFEAIYSFLVYFILRWKKIKK